MRPGGDWPAVEESLPSLGLRLGGKGTRERLQYQGRQIAGVTVAIKGDVDYAVGDFNGLTDKAAAPLANQAPEVTINTTLFFPASQVDLVDPLCGCPLLIDHNGAVS